MLSRVLRVGIVLALVLVGLVLLVPVVLSMDWMRTRIESEISAKIGAPCRIGGYSFGLLSGLEINDLTIANPAGFDPDHDLFAMKSLRGDVSLLGLLRGRFGIEGNIEGLALRVFQREDGTTNFGEILGVRASAPPVSDGKVPPSASKRRFDASGLRLDLRLRDSFIEVVHETNGVLERMEQVSARISKDYGSDMVKLEFACDLARPSGGAPGRLEISIDANTDVEQPIEARVRAVGLDLARYRPVLATFLPAEQVTAFAGVLTANTRVSGRPRELLTVEGQLDLVEPHFAGPLFGGLDLGAPRWSMTPAMTVGVPKDGSPMTLDLTQLTADLGFLQVKGLPSGEAKATRTGIEFALDVDALAQRGGSVPAALRGSGARVAGQLRMPLAAQLAEDLGRGDLAKVIAGLELTARLDVTEMTLADQKLALAAKLGMDGGKIALDSTAGTYGGGPLRLSLRVDATQLDNLPLSLTLDVDGAQLGTGALTVLQYGFPLAAGASAAAAGASPVDLTGSLALHLELSGDGVPQSGQPLLAWMDGWSGAGRLGLREGQLRPAAALGDLLRLTGDSGTLKFDGFDNDFRVARGFVETLGAKLDAKGRSFGLTGRTSLAGVLDWTLDVKSMLLDHKDGQTVLKHLGDTPIGAVIAGTVDAPSLAMPKFDAILKQALQRAVERGAGDLLKKEAGSLLDSVLGGGKSDIGGVLEGVIPGITGRKDDAPANGGATPPVNSSPVDTGKTVLDQILQQGGPPKDPNQVPGPTTKRPDPIGDMLKQMLERKAREEQQKPPPVAPPVKKSAP